MAETVELSQLSNLSCGLEALLASSSSLSLQNWSLLLGTPELT
jgi:hypothetical protein